jgi:acetoin utilization protein AcuB
MKKAPKIKQAMTAFPYSVDIRAPIEEARSFMREHKIRHLPVTEDGVLIGVVTDRDIKLLLGPDFAYPKPNEIVVGDAMVEESYVVDLNTPMVDVLEHMVEHRIGSALVTRKGKLAGVFTSTDACRAFADFLERTYPNGGDDDDDAA